MYSNGSSWRCGVRTRERERRRQSVENMSPEQRRRKRERENRNALVENMTPKQRLLKRMRQNRWLRAKTRAKQAKTLGFTDY